MCPLPSLERGARRGLALVLAGLLFAAGCAPATGPGDGDAADAALLEAWLIPEVEEADEAPDSVGSSGVRGRSGFGDDLELLAGGEFVLLEGIPEPNAPTPVAIHVTSAEVLRLNGDPFVAVYVAGAGQDGVAQDGVAQGDSEQGGTAQEGDILAGLFPFEPSPSPTPVATGRPPIGLWVTGAPIFNWGNGRTYRGEGVWRSVVPGAVGDDGVSCAGPSADELTPHVYPECLALHLGDDSGQHSPIYGFAADGYPVYGPWTDLELLARSSWRLRDYETAGSPTGCEQPGRRTCLLANPLGPSAGTLPATAEGPSTAETPAGAFFEDYWFDISLDDGSPHALDAFNGHEHDELGYHYHVTRIHNGDGSFSDVFPYVVGPWFRGELHPGDPHAEGPRLPEDAVTSGSTTPEPPPEPLDPLADPRLICTPRRGVCD